MSDGNKRILGDVWINQENLDRQREFFRDIIESYQDKYGGDFDASTLQGFAASDFATAEQGSLAEHAIQDPLWLGRKRIANVEDRQYIYTDAVWLNRNDEADPSSFDLNAIDWFSTLPSESLTSALVRIYEKVKEIETNLDAKFDTKLDTSVYQNFLNERFTPLESQFTNSSVSFIDSTTGQTKQGFNADLINGLRPIIITEAEYNRMKNGTEEEQAIINYWRNFFIFVDSIPGDYNQPWEYSLTDPYSFRVYDGYLQVKNNVGEEWVDVASLQDLLEGGSFDNIIATFLSDSNNFIIDETSLLNSLQNISPTTINELQSSYPFLSSSLHDDYIYDLKIDNNSTYINQTVDSNNFKKVNIDMTQMLKDKQVLTPEGAPRIDGMQTALTNYGSQINTMNQHINQISGNINSITSVNETQTSDISDIKSSLASLKNDLKSLESQINAMSRWSTTYIQDLTGTYGYGNPIYYNSSLRICSVYCNGITYYHYGNNASKWEHSGYRVPSPLYPKVQYHTTTSNPQTNIKILTDGQIDVRHTSNKNGSITVWFEAFYYY